MPGGRTEVSTRTYVLVHGAWHGGWCWVRVADRLTAAGHRVFTPTQTGLGERKHLLSAAITPDTFTDDIANVIEAEELSDVILVGHSFGGRSICGVADRMPKALRRLVFLDAGLPESGKSAFDLTLPELRAARIKAAQEFSGGLSMPPPPAAAFGVTDANDVTWVERRLTPHPTATYALPLVLKHPIGNGVPTTYIRCVAPAYANTARSAEYAQARPDCQYLEIRTGHDAMITAPAELTEMLLALK
jgi:pimeloyl-ACP methyl ester carboxylesterase